MGLFESFSKITANVKNAVKSFVIKLKGSKADDFIEAEYTAISNPEEKLSNNSSRINASSPAFNFAHARKILDSHHQILVMINEERQDLETIKANAVKIINQRFGTGADGVDVSMREKTPQNTAFVKALYQKYECDVLANEIARLKTSYQPEILQAMKDIRHVMGAIGWQRSSYEQHEKAVKAYKFLLLRNSDEYRRKAFDVCAHARALGRITEDQAWQVFSKDPTRYAEVEDLPSSYANKKEFGSATRIELEKFLEGRSRVIQGNQSGLSEIGVETGPMLDAKGLANHAIQTLKSVIQKRMVLNVLASTSLQAGTLKYMENVFAIAAQKAHSEIFEMEWYCNKFGRLKLDVKNRYLRVEKFIQAIYVQAFYKHRNGAIIKTVKDTMVALQDKDKTTIKGLERIIVAFQTEADWKAATDSDYRRGIEAVECLDDFVLEVSKLEESVQEIGDYSIETAWNDFVSHEEMYRDYINAIAPNLLYKELKYEELNADKTTEILKEHQRLLAEFKKSNQLKEKTEREAHETIEKIAKEAQKDGVRLYVDKPTLESKRLIKAFYQYQEGGGIKTGVTQQVSEISRNIDQVQQVLPEEKWNHVTNEVREETIQSRDFLEEQLRSDYPSKIHAFSQAVSEVSHITEDEAWKDFGLCPSLYFEGLEKLNPNLLATDRNGLKYDLLNAEGAQELIEASNEILDSYKEAEGQVEGYKDEVGIATDNFQAAVAKNELRKIPIDALNQDLNGKKRNFRINTLKDAGFKTVADMVDAKVWDVASVYGISDIMAIEMKALAEKMLRERKKNTKIKITVDNKTPEATKLVKAICQYRESDKLAKEAKAVQLEYESDVNESLHDLNEVSAAEKWESANEEAREKGLDACRRLHRRRVAGRYRQRANDLNKRIKSLKKIAADEAWKMFASDSVGFFTSLEKLNPGILGSEDIYYGLPNELAQEIESQPINVEGLGCSLRRYQELGVKYALHFKRVLLGDEMGLGKTIQALAVMTSLKNEGAKHFAVICPASVVANWCREVEKKSSLPVCCAHGVNALSALSLWKRRGGIAVASYDSAQYILPYLKNLQLALVVVDEAHYVKNPSAKRTKRVGAIAAESERVLFMTGTALENRVGEMITLIGYLQPNVAKEARNFSMLTQASQFRDAIAKVYYRRKREQVLNELPELVETEEWCSLASEHEISAYEDAICAREYMSARRVSWNVSDLVHSSKAKRMAEIIHESEKEGKDGRKILVFSYFRDTISKIAAFLGHRCIGVIHGGVSSRERQLLIDKFETAPAGSVLIAQIVAGGVGLNIQAASVVIICEPQVKPSLETQAISRAYRMGQSRNVFVHRLLSEKTIDEKMMRRLQKKQNEFNAFADESVAASVSEGLSEGAMKKMFEEERERILQRKGI